MHLRQRLDVPDVSAKEIGDGLKTLREQAEQPNVVGDLPALSALVAELEEGLTAKRQTESTVRAEAKKVAAAEREKIVAEAERLAAGGARELTLIGQNVNAYAGEMADGTVVDLATPSWSPPPGPAASAPRPTATT